MRIERRFSDALGHGRGRPYGGTTPAAQNTAATSLRGSGGLLLLWLPSRGIPWPVYPYRSPQRRCARARRPAGDGFHRLATHGGEGVVSGPYHRTHLHCGRANQDIEASPADCLKTLVGRSSWTLCCLWHVGPDARSGLGAAQLERATSLGLAGSRMAASGPMAGRVGVRFRLGLCDDS